MAVHFFNHSTSTNGTTNPPNTGTEIWSMSGANCKIIDIFSKMPAHDKIRSTSVSGSPQVTLNVFFTTMQGNIKKYATSVFSIIIPKVPPANDLNKQEISLLACKMRHLYNRSVS